MSNTVIRVENISKMYDLGLVGTGTLSKDLNRTWAKWTGKPDPYATIAELNDRTKKSESGSVWVLKDINFDVQQGEVLGIIGKNGAGKSTLLKILSKITVPTTGQIKIKGRVASLLEVGTGMHPEMTARQNIYLNGAIMGMKRYEITAKLDEIVEFAGIGKYIDTPIKRFSSGMQVRLGFAVAAFLEPEILIVDEVLAVGDAEFQKKAIGKMQDVSKGEGRTVLFVSHNMASVQSLCTKGLLLDKGMITYEGNIENSISRYLNEGSQYGVLNTENRKGNGKIIIKKILYQSNETTGVLQTGQKSKIEFHLLFKDNINTSNFRIDFRIDNAMGARVAWFSNTLIDADIPKIFEVVSFEFEKLNLNTGRYYITTFVTVNNEICDWIQNALSLDVNEGDFYGTGKKVPTEQSNVVINFKVKYNS
jgi:lipopolysaccharide transport system ATP-binding protein